LRRQKIEAHPIVLDGELERVVRRSERYRDVAGAGVAADVGQSLLRSAEQGLLGAWRKQGIVRQIAMSRPAGRPQW
jgi:hypothetical protein